MRLLPTFALGLTLLAGAPAQATPSWVQGKTPSQVLEANLASGAQVDPKELLIVAESTEFRGPLAHSAEAIGCKLLRGYGRRPMYLFECEPRLSLLERFRVLEKLPGVRWLEAGYIESLEAAPDDLQGSQWYHQNSGQVLDGSRGTMGADMGSLAAWEISTGDPAKVILIVDVGLWAGHQELAEQMWRNPGESNCTNGVDDDHNGYIDDCRGWDFGDDDNNPDPTTLPTDDSCLRWHATMIAGLAGARGNNGKGMSGINWNASFMNVKKHSSSSCNSTSNSSIEAIVYGIDNGASVISMSFSSSSYSATFESALKEAEQRGLIAVSSGGNGGENNDTLTRYPNEYDIRNKLVVVNSDNRDGIYAGSNYGPRTVDLAAPGTSVLSTSVEGPLVMGFGTGSSYSAGVAAGAVSLVWSAFPMLSSTEIVDAIKEGARRLPGMDCAQTARCIKLGARIDLYGGMKAAGAKAPPQLTLVDRGLTELGDGDGRLEPGEQLELRPTLANAGRGGAFGLSGQIVLDSVDLGLVQDQLAIGNVPAGSASDPNALAPVVIAVNGACATDQTIQGRLELTDKLERSFSIDLSFDLACAPPPVTQDPNMMGGDPNGMGTDPDGNGLAEEGCSSTRARGSLSACWLGLAALLLLARRRG